MNTPNEQIYRASNNELANTLDRIADLKEQGLQFGRLVNDNDDIAALREAAKRLRNISLNVPFNHEQFNC